MDERQWETVGAEAPAAPDPGKAKKDFSRLGFALLTFFAVSSGLEVAANLLLTKFDLSSPLLQWGLGYILPIYVLGVPAALLVMRAVPAERVEPQKLGAGKLPLYLLMCFPIMYGGNLIGTILSGMFSGGASENPLTGLVLGETSWIQIIVLAVLAPLFEEFIFRKQLIDRIGRYGEKTAILFSGLTFGLFHGNLYQFFYAFALGALFAWIYTRTRKLRYSVILHMIINFIGSVVGPWIVKQSQLDMTSELTAETVAGDPAGAGLLAAYGAAIIALSIVGLVVLIRRRKQFELRPTAEELPKGTGFRTSCLNAGVLLFALVCVGVFVVSLVMV